MSNIGHYIDKYFLNPPSWYRWEERKTIDGTDRVGAYVLAIHEGRAKPKIGPLSKEVVYIGETHKKGRNLIVRWREFNRAALGTGTNHVGGETFRERNLSLEHLWVMAFPSPSELDDLGATILAQLLERELIWEYYKKHGRLPICNKK